MPAWIKEFFSSHTFMPHGHCYLWQPGILWLEVVSNSLIGLAYIAISSMLAYLVFRIRDIPFKTIYLAFGVFIIACGLTHFLDVYVIWKPIYWVDGSLRAVTAFASVGTALLLPPLIPRAMALARGARAAQDRGIELETLVKELGTLYERTKELEQLKTQFFANLSHELRTPLTLVLGPVEKLIESGGIAPERRGDLEMMRRNARLLLKHVNELLDVSRMEAGEMKPDYAKVDVARLIRLSAANFDSLAAERAVAYEIDVPDSLTGEIDADKIERVAINLLSNAFKFTPRGGRVRCALRVAGVSAGETESSAPILLSVSDSGPGIAVEHRQSVFERFRQIDGGATRRAGGTGLGLTIARDFVHLHKGRIHVEDAPEGGAQLTVELPRRAPPGTPVRSSEAPEGLFEAAEAAVEELREAPGPAAVHAASPGRSHVLVVEDNPEMNRFVCQTLAEDHAVSSAFDGAEGLQKAASLRPDLIVTDLMMPAMNGEQLVHALRKDESLVSVPIVLLTARADDTLRLELLRTGAQDYLMKPFAAAELRARVANLVSSKRARDVLRQELDTRTGDLEALATEVSARRRQAQAAFASMTVARDIAERASRAKSSFLALISHELRTPLQGLHIHVDRLKRDEEALTARQREIVERMGGSVARLTGLVESVLHHTRLQSGYVALRAEPFDVAALARATLDELRPEAHARGIQVRIDAPAGLPPLVSDPEIVGLVLASLLDNAIKFTERGSVELSVSHAEGRYRLAVTDSGPGIPPAERQRIFEPFEQLDPPDRKHVRGAGLGLTLVRDMVTALSGKIELDSEVGKGSTFTVVLGRPSVPPGAPEIAETA